MIKIYFKRYDVKLWTLYENQYTLKATNESLLLKCDDAKICSDYEVDGENVEHAILEQESFQEQGRFYARILRLQGRERGLIVHLRDPHFVTFDLFNYTFNAFGDYYHLYQMVNNIININE